MEKLYSPQVIHTPAIKTEFFEEKTYECVVMTIAGDEYTICETASSGDNFWGNSKRGFYGRGIGRTEKDPFKPARTGLLGQMAYAELVGGVVDTSYKKGGDRHDDLLFGEYKVDVKCSMKNHGRGLIYHTNEWGRKVVVDKDVYVFSYINSEDRENKQAEVVIVGFATNEDVCNSKIAPGRWGRHMNYEVEFASLKPIDMLTEEFLVNYKNTMLTSCWHF
jgi:hypothetical protein